MRVGVPPSTYATRLCTSLCFNGHPAIQLKYMYSNLLLALLFGCVVYASATLVTDSTRSPNKHGASQTSSAAL
jgi:hypothetical protein